MENLLDMHSPLFDPLKDYEDIKKYFYSNQKSPSRAGYISDTIDKRYEREENLKKKQKMEELELEIEEKSFIEEGESLAAEVDDDPDYEMLNNTTEINSSILNDSCEMMQTRSGRSLRSMDENPQINTAATQPSIRKVRNCTDQSGVWSLIVESSSIFLLLDGQYLIVINNRFGCW